MMTWAHRPHGVRTRGKKILLSLKASPSHLRILGGQSHSTLNTHMENVDFLISEEAQQD